MAAMRHRGSAICRFCGAPLSHTFIDLGMSPLCESYRTGTQLEDMEVFYPLHVRVCDKCFLVQLGEFVSPEHIFSEYAYFSSYSDTWLSHARAYVDQVTNRFALGSESFVVEVASNDGYLLQYFVNKGIPVLGVEPAANVAETAVKKGIPTLVRFFGEGTANDLAMERRRADLIVGNNVLAQVPDVNDFVKGMKVLLKPGGVITIEFPHLVTLMEGNQFDTIYHEHYSYFSFATAERIFAAHGITLFDVEEIPTHGGSLRIYGRHDDDGSKPATLGVSRLRDKESAYGLGDLGCYSSFGEKVRKTKRNLLAFLIRAKRDGKRIAGYGAPGKGNTLLNYCGIRTDFLDFTVDRNPYKQGKFLPGTHIPIHSPDRIVEVKPDYVLILPWNFRDEIVRQLSYIRSWGGQFVIPIPEVTVLP